jgi:peroxiredoxin
MDDPTLPPTPEGSPTSSRLRRKLIGPFTAAQVLAVVAAITISGVALAVLTSPITRPVPTAPRPGSSMYVVGSPEPGLSIGDIAPEFSGTTPSGETVQLADLDGNPIRLADLRGHPVWINFWATWCPPCQEETPILRDMHEKYTDDGLEVVAISVQETTADDVRAYVERYGLDYTVGFDATSAIFHTYHAFGLPTQFFLDENGVIRDVVLGPITREQAETTIQGLLGIEGTATSSPAGP